MRRLAGVFLLVLFQLFLHVSLVQADESFENKLATTYTVSEDGSTTIAHQFKIKNRTPTVFLKQYSLSLVASELSSVVVEYKQKKLEPTITKNGNTTTIAISFPDELVGEGKERVFTISYQSTELAQRAGKVLEVQIPPFTTDEQYSEHTTTLKTPFLFGTPVRVSPHPDSSVLDGQFITTQFTNVGNSAIVALFGTEQFFTLTLRYNIENTTGNQGAVQIALPPDTAFQKMQYQSLEPTTHEIERDPDGNWIATYHLPPHTAQTVYLTALVRTTEKSDPKYVTAQPVQDHFSEQKYWNTNSTEIQKIVQEHPTLESLYQFVVSTLQYSYAATQTGEILPRLGAVAALQNPTAAVCQEFTDLFITLARAQGIAARRLVGYAYSKNETLKPLSFAADVLHAWPEYYDESEHIWKQVDPTWQNTTGGVDYFHQFDLNHIVFAMNGVSSTLPFPAGSYKTNMLNTQDVLVELAHGMQPEKPNFSVSLTPVEFFGMPLPGLYSLHLLNQTGTAWYNVRVALESSPEISSTVTSYELPAVVPFQEVVIPLQLTTRGYSITTQPLHSRVEIATENYDTGKDFTVTAGPKGLQYFTEQTRVVSVVVGGVIFAISAWSLLVFKRKR